VAVVNVSLQQFDPRSFQVLPENQLAVESVKKLAPGRKRRGIRLVTLVGPAGVGKSHLARELFQSWEAHLEQRKRILTTASQYAAELAEASSSDAVSRFQMRYRNDIAVLIVEDLQILGPRKETQQQLLATLDDVQNQGGMVLLTSTVMPGAIKGFSRRLVNRLHGGLCVTIDLPAAQSRRKLIQHFLAGLSIRLGPRDIEQLVAEYPVSPRELLGILTQLQSESRLRRGSTRNRDNVIRTFIAEHGLQSTTSLDDLCRLTARRFGVKASELKGPRRSQSLALARQVGMYLARELLRMNYVEIGQFFNRGNHSTVIHACRKIAEQRQADPALDLEIQSIQEELKNAGLRV
jgi:chromosomal replication initiator protein